MSSRSLNAGSERGGGGLRLNLAVLAAGIASFVNMYCTMAVLPLLARSFHVSQAATGLTVTAPLLATAIMAPVIGAISDRFGRRRLILGAAVLLVLPTVAAAGAGSFHTLLLWRFVQGLTLPFIFTVTIAYIGEETAGAASVRLAATYMSGAIFGGFAGRAIPGLVAQFWGWRVSLLLIALITLAMAVVIGLCLPAERNFTPVMDWRGSLGSFPRHLRNRRLLANNFIGFGVLFCLIGVFTYVNFRLAAPPYSLGPAALGGIFAVYLAAVVVNPLAARLAARFGHARVMAGVAPIAILGLLLTLAAPLPLIVLGLLIVCCMVFLQQTLATAFIGMAARTGRSAAVGLYVTTYYIGGGMGGIVPALPFHEFGWPGAVAVVIAVQLAMLGLGLRYWK